MSVLEIIKSRRSIRDFKKQEVPENITDALIEAIRWAPSAGNLQSRKFYFVFNDDIKKKLAVAALNQNFIARAPLVVIGCLDLNIAGRYGDRGVNLYSVQDVSASVMSMMLVAHELGLGSVWVGAFNEIEAGRILGLPDHLRPISIVPVGFPSELPGRTSRKSKEDIVEWVL